MLHVSPTDCDLIALRNSCLMPRFGFVEYEEKEDAAAAIDNMHNAELFGRWAAHACIIGLSLPLLMT